MILKPLVGMVMTIGLFAAALFELTPPAVVRVQIAGYAQDVADAAAQALGPSDDNVAAAQTAAASEATAHDVTVKSLTVINGEVQVTVARTINSPLTRIKELRPWYRVTGSATAKGP
ncbi:MAG TPA: hypothetical protein VFH45_13195 [Acidimicrobiales bacterium]|nr:hypothetical protein [Acidimicrobiales bacterium]